MEKTLRSAIKIILIWCGICMVAHFVVVNIILISMRVQINTLRNDLIKTEEKTNRRIEFVVDRISEQLQSIHKGDEK